jgi:Pyruvate/2-oxoacid:ferredoxin oxidoreductase gamma subunit
MLEQPMDVCRVVSSAGAAYVKRYSGYAKDLPAQIESAVRFEGFSVIDIWGVCPGRYTKRNRLTPAVIEASLAGLPPADGPVPENDQKEYGKHYRELADGKKAVSPPGNIQAAFDPPESGRKEVLLLGSAGQRVITAGEILCLAGLTAGLNVTQKNEYNITVLRGHSISELILSPEEIDFTGIVQPAVVVALSVEGVARRRRLFNHLNRDAVVIRADGVDVPPCRATVHQADFKSLGVKKQDRALASLAVLARLNKVINRDMLRSALRIKFKDKILSSALDLVDRIDTAAS